MMTIRQPDRLGFSRIILAFSTLLTLPAVSQILEAAREQRASNIAGSNWSLLISLVFILGIASLVLFIVLFTHRRESIWVRLETFPLAQGGWKVLPVTFLVIFLAVYPAVMLHPYYGMLLDQPWIRFFIAWWLSLLGMFCLKSLSGQFSWAGALAAALLLQASVARVASTLPAISADPFSLGWAETSRFYDASLFLSSQLYGTRAPWAVLHPLLHLLLAIPFLIPGSPLWLHRLWQVFLRLGLTFVTGIAFSRWLKIEDRLLRWCFIVWVFVFLLQGPIYLHLLLPVIIILLGFSETNPRRTLAVVIAASLLAGLSRINWFPVPAMLASALYFLRMPLKGQRVLRYLSLPALWFLVGVLSALASQWAYIFLSGNLAHWRAFYSSTTSALLWYRLWPNETFRLGILPAIIIVSLPLILIIFWKLWEQPGILHPLRLFGLGAEILILFVGGLTVSVKIGSGGDLHNLDATIILLMVVAGTLFWNRQGSEQDSSARDLFLPWALAAFAVLVPFWFGIQSVQPVHTNDSAVAKTALEQIRSQVEQTVHEGGEVLFISQPQLLTFKEVDDVPLVTDYEKEFLIEMVMANNEPYLTEFYNDLHARRFALIVADTQWYKYQDAGESWGAENNLWVRAVTLPLLCSYQQTRIPGVNVSLLTPRTQSINCPYPRLSP
jgi:hypothetical protein